MSFLGKYEHPRPFPPQRHPYPWLIAAPGDWFVVFNAEDAEKARSSVSHGACDASKRYSWKPKFRTRRLSKHVMMVERVA